MPVLTYNYLGEAVQLGQPLGCDSTGWPYQVTQIEHIADDSPQPFSLYEAGPSPAGALFATRVTVEPWPIPGPEAGPQAGYKAAMAHAAERRAGLIR